MLLLNSAWWERLSDQDHQLLHELPPPHGELIAWLERHLVNHGPSPWSVLEAALAEEGLLDSARPLVSSAHGPEEALLEELQHVVRGLRIAQLKSQSQALAASNPQGPDLERFREILARIRELEATGS